MSIQHLLSVGCIPKNHPGGLIMCGDPLASGTREVTFSIQDDLITSTEITEFKYNGKGADWFLPDSRLWQELSTTINQTLNPAQEISAKDIAGVWHFFIDEPIDMTSELVELPNEYGEFYNEDSQFNHTFYFRFQEVEDNQYISDRILILRHA